MSVSGLAVAASRRDARADDVEESLIDHVGDGTAQLTVQADLCAGRCAGQQFARDHEQGGRADGLKGRGRECEVRQRDRLAGTDDPAGRVGGHDAQAGP